MSPIKSPFAPPNFLEKIFTEKKLDFPKLEEKQVDTTGNQTTEGDARDKAVRNDEIPENRALANPPVFPDRSANFAPTNNETPNRDMEEASRILKDEFNGLEGDVPHTHIYWKLKWNSQKQ